MPTNIRDDVQGRMVLDVLEGHIALEDLEKAQQQYVNRYRAAFENRFRDVSIEKPLPGTDDLR